MAAKPFYWYFQALAKSLILRNVVVEQLACLAVARMPRPAPSSSVKRLCSFIDRPALVLTGSFAR
jgi:hypothetical protein